MNWWAGYVQDQWKATQRLTVTAGLRWDFVSPPSFSDAVSGLDIATGKFLITRPFLPLFPKAIGPSGFYYAKYNGFEPRVGLVYQAAPHTVARAAFAIMDDHNHSLVQEDQNLRLSWPNAVTISVSQQNQGLPTLYLNNLPPEPLSLTPFTFMWAAPRTPTTPSPMQWNTTWE